MPEAPTLKGRFVTLRPVDEGDAEYILSLRTDTTLNRFLKSVDNDVEKQRAWITGHNKRAEGYYFMMINSQQQPCGVIRISDIKEDTCIIGSWIVARECSGFAAVESLMLCFSYSLESLGCSRCIGVMHEDNASVLRVYSALGGTYIGKKEDFLEYEMTKENFKKAKQKYRWFN